MRSLTRIINVELLFFGIAFATILLLILKKWKISSLLLFILIFPLLVLDNSIKYDSAVKMNKAELETRHNKLVEKMDHLSPGTVIAYEPEELNDPAHFYQLDAMLAAQSLHLKSVNGYSAIAPPTFDKYWVNPSEESRKIWFQRFPQADTISVVVIK
jgi:hypothetical protein